MLRVTSGSALNKAGSKNVNYWLIFCFAPYSHQEKWNASESPEHKWKSVRTIALSYFGYAIKWNINILRVHSSTPQPVAVWAGINVISELSHVQNFPGSWESRKNSAEVPFCSLRKALAELQKDDILAVIVKRKGEGWEIPSPSLSPINCSKPKAPVANAILPCSFQILLF